MKNSSSGLFIGFCLAMACLLSAASTIDAAEPFMGAYIHIPALLGTGTDVAARERTIAENLDRFQASGLRVLMPFVTTTAGQAHYASRLIPEKLYGKWDPLAVFVREARQRGLKIYPVICVLACGQHDRPAGILGQHPEWALRDPQGKPLGFISAGHPEARAWVVSVLKEIASDYQPDGLLLDYLRFPSASAQLDPVSQAKFQQGHPPEQFPPASKQYNQELLAFKREGLTQLVGQISQELRPLNGKLRIAVYMWGAHELPGTRDWRTWADRGYLDMLNLTGYAYREQYGDQYLQVLEKRVRDVAAIVRELPKPVELTICVGINTSHGRIKSASEIDDYLRISKQCGVQGAAFFTWTYLQPYLDEVKKAGYLERFVAGLPPPGGTLP